MDERPTGVSELLERVSLAAQKEIGRTCHVQGEVVSLHSSTAGHIYFSLTDHASFLTCFLAKSRVGYMSVRLEEGMQIVVSGALSVRSAQSQLQITVEALSRIGDEVSILKEIEARRLKLVERGVLGVQRPKVPEVALRVAVVTASGGAGLQDILEILRRRFVQSVEIFPASVQGQNAAKEIFFQLLRASRSEADVILLARGGGSLQDLLPFSDEIVVQAIAQSPVPVITAIGHQRDTTLADAAASASAITPTEGALMVSCSLDEERTYLQSFGFRLARALKKKSIETRKQTEELRNRQQKGLERSLSLLKSRLFDINADLQCALKEKISFKRRELRSLQTRFEMALEGREAFVFGPKKHYNPGEGIYLKIDNALYEVEVKRDV